MTTKGLNEADKQRILTVLTNSQQDPTLRSWATGELASAGIDIKEITDLSDEQYTANIEKDPQKRSELIAANKLKWAQFRLNRASREKDRPNVEKYAHDMIIAREEYYTTVLAQGTGQLAAVSKQSVAVSIRPLKQGKSLFDTFTVEFV